MRCSPVYRHVDRTTTVLGLEVPEDLFALGAVAGVGMIVGASPLPLVAALALLALALRLLKRGKPRGYLRTLLRFAVRPGYWSAAEPDVVGRRRPFPFSIDARPGRAPTQGDPT